MAVAIYASKSKCCKHNCANCAHDWHDAKRHMRRVLLPKTDLKVKKTIFCPHLEWELQEIIGFTPTKIFVLFFRNPEFSLRILMVLPRMELCCRCGKTLIYSIPQSHCKCAHGSYNPTSEALENATFSCPYHTRETVPRTLKRYPVSGLYGSLCNTILHNLRQTGRGNLKNPCLINQANSGALFPHFSETYLYNSLRKRFCITLLHNSSKQFLYKNLFATLFPTPFFKTSMHHLLCTSLQHPSTAPSTRLQSKISLQHFSLNLQHFFQYSSQHFLQHFSPALISNAPLLSSPTLLCNTSLLTLQHSSPTLVYDTFLQYSSMTPFCYTSLQHSSPSLLSSTSLHNSAPTLPSAKLFSNTFLNQSHLSNASLQHSQTLLNKTLLQHFATTLFSNASPQHFSTWILYTSLRYNTLRQHFSTTSLYSTLLSKSSQTIN